MIYNRDIAHCTGPRMQVMMLRYKCHLCYRHWLHMNRKSGLFVPYIQGYIQVNKKGECKDFYKFPKNDYI